MSLIIVMALLFGQVEEDFKSSCIKGDGTGYYLLHDAWPKSECNSTGKKHNDVRSFL